MRWSAVVRLASVLPLSLLSGCQLFILGAVNIHHMTLERATAHRELKQIEVVDVQSDAPIPNARLHVVYDFDWLDDWEEDRVTNAQGLVNVKVATESARVLRVSVQADGYRPQYRANLSSLEFESRVRVLLGRDTPVGASPSD